MNGREISEAPAVPQLRGRLMAPRAAPGLKGRLPAHRQRLQPWARALMAAQLAAIVVLGAVVVAREEPRAAYRTLGAADSSAATGARLVVVFDPATTELDLRSVLRSVDGRIVGGPTQTNAYLLDVPPGTHEQAVRTLKTDRRVVLVESLAPEGAVSRMRAVLMALLCVVFGTCAAQEGPSAPASPGAPDATLYALRACGQEGRGAAVVCSSFTLAKALQLVLDERVGVINLSVGGPRDRLLERLIDVASSRGVIVVSAADWAAGKMSFPASHRGVLAVARLRGRMSFAVLLAPGRDIPAPVPGRQWAFVSGSSFAAIGGGCACSCAVAGDAMSLLPP